MIDATRRRLLAAGALSIAGPFARANTRPRRVGVFITGPTDKLQPFIAEIESRLHALGFEQGSIVFEGRAADRDPTRYPALAADLVRTRPEVIVTQGEAATRALLKATSEIPIVAAVQDPVGLGLARSVSRPGGQVTGSTFDHVELSGKVVAVLRTILPRLSRFVVICKPGEDERHAQGIVNAARALGVHAEVSTVTDLEGVQAVIRRLEPSTSAAFVTMMTGIKETLVARVALERRIPLMGHYPFMAQEGYLVTYRMFRDDPIAPYARTVAKILRGAKAADLPFELPDKSQLAVNAGTAKALGIVLPLEILLQADHVYE